MLPSSTRWSPLRLLIVFLVQVSKYPATLGFARQAVKVISDARNSNALLSWLVTEAPGDPGHSPQIGDKAGQPCVVSPLSGHMRNGIRSYPSASSRQITGSNLYVESYHPDSEAHAYSGKYFCSKPVSVIVGESKHLLRSSASPSYVPSPREDVRRQIRQGDSQH
jgi:hypothetical protein